MEAVIALEMEGVSINDIVTWTTRSANEKIQGKVYSINPAKLDPYKVEFFHESSWLFGSDFYFRDQSKPFTIDLAREDIQLEEDWDYQVLLKRNGVDKAFRLYEPKEKLVKGKTICMNTKCKHLAQELAFANLLGVMYVMNVCPDHYRDINGVWTEDLSDYGVHLA